MIPDPGAVIPDPGAVIPDPGALIPDPGPLEKVIQGGFLARFTNGKNRGSQITDIKISFSRVMKITSKMLFSITYSYTRKSD